MFGHDEDDASSQPADNVVAPSAPLPAVSPVDENVNPAAVVDNSADANAAPSELLAENTDATLPPANDVPALVIDDDTGQVSTEEENHKLPKISKSETSKLLEIKQNALQNLSPLLDQLDQTPEERFKTMMMMIQAADDQSLINEAYDAANKISDEKVRAQALLDVVNEINYFTQAAAAEETEE